MAESGGTGGIREIQEGVPVSIPTTWRKLSNGMWVDTMPPGGGGYRMGTSFHDNPYGPCYCGATHNFGPDYRDILVF